MSLSWQPEWHNSQPVTRNGQVPSLVCLLTVLFSGLALGADEVPETAAVPEPSALLLGGLCGLLFLFWRRKS